jgi:TolB-like protein/Tfp pilus assembly protein PilF
MPLPPNTRLGRYEIKSLLGAGGMGEVYLARDTKLDRKVALKILPSEFAAHPDRMRRFVLEAKTASALNHPNILTIYEIGETDSDPFIATELIEGETLRERLRREPITLGEALDVATQVASALAAAHQAGIIHRDIKPENVMVRGDGLVKVLDFGLAKLTAGAASDPEGETRIQSDTEPGMIMGTVAYMSPQQARGQAVDRRTDVWSLGVVLYEMLGGRQPFRGETAPDTLANILQREPEPLNVAALPADIARIVGKMLAKDLEARYSTIAEVVADLKGMQKRIEFEAELRRTPLPDAKAEAQTELVESATSGRSGGVAIDSGAARADEGFWVAVLPFKVRDEDPAIAVLADGLSEEIVTGLSRFSYLRVMARSSTSSSTAEAADARAEGKALGARYVMEGSVRQAGTKVRFAVQLVDTTSGAHLWAETYDRVFNPEAAFELQDDLVPRIVSTCADRFGVLARSISDAVRGGEPGQLGPYEALMRGFGYHHRLTAAEHAEAREALERAVERAPSNADCWAMLSWIYSHEHAHGFNVRPGSLDRALAAARHAVDIAPSNQLAQQALAVVLFFRKETAGCLSAAERAMALNPLDTSNEAMFLIKFTGDWDRGCALIRRAMELNPHHPRWYATSLSINEYRLANYRAVVDEVVKANAPDVFWTNMLLAAAHAQLGELTAARNALRDLLAQKEDFAQSAGQLLSKWFDPQLVEHLIEGLRKAGLDMPGPEQSAATPPAAPEAVAIAVLPFSDMSSTKDQEYLCEGMAEEIMNALTRVAGIRVASRTSAFRAQKGGGDLSAIGRALSVGHLLEGSVRTAGDRLRVTAQLTDVASGFQLWSERFDRKAEDIFAVQDEIAAGVVEAVKTRLSPGEHAVTARPQPANLDAYRSYLKGRHLRGKEHHGEALRAFEEAVRLDPSHAPSWTGLAEITVLASVFGMIPARDACATARQALATATRLQGESAEGLHVEAFVAWIEKRWAAMEAAWRRAIELQPNNVLALASFGIVLASRQRLDEALPFLERARQADPLASFPYALTGESLLNCGRPQEALRYLEDALSFEKEDATALDCAGMARVALGRFEEGIATLEHVVAVSHRGAHFLGTLGWALATAGRTAEARTILEELRARPPGAPTVVSEAWLLGALGEVDAAFEVVARAEEDCLAYLYFTGLPGFDPLRSDPRFGGLLERLDLPSA